MRIVLVDSSRTVLKCVARLLQAREHEVDVFCDGPEALKFIAATPAVDALITSCELLSGSGMELCWQARLLAGSRRPFYIILMSSSGDRHTVSEALDSGADDFIGKPPVPDELYARLRAAERLLGLQRDLIRLATTDPLTGLLNRRAFFERAEEVCRFEQATCGPSVILFDLDHFKSVNDTYGHDAGDTVLRGVAQEVRREGAPCGRLGGEEFAIMLDGRGKAAAVAFAENLRERIAGLPFEADSRPFSITSSFGVAERISGDGIDDLLRRADAALYAAKRAGRNCVVGGPVASIEGTSGVIRAAPRGAAAPRTAA